MKTRREIEAQVLSLLEEQNISRPPIPIEKIARDKGLPIVETSLSADISGALILTPGANGIAVNVSHSPNRRRFTIAHELAHFLLEHKGVEDHVDWQFTVIRRDGTSSEASDNQEIEANFFAANLLMPKEFIRFDMEEALSYKGEPNASDAFVESLAEKYQVSQAAMRYRLINLGFISPL